MLRIVAFATALAEFIADGCATITAGQYRERLEICDSCPLRCGHHCSKCGCLIVVKARGRAWNCPDDPPRWPEIEASDSATESKG